MQFMLALIAEERSWEDITPEESRRTWPIWGSSTPS